MALAASAAQGDAVDWDNHRGELSKNYDNGTASYMLATDTNTLTFQLAHQGATGGLFSFSQWRIDNWPMEERPDPDYNTVANANNDVALSLYGYYGEDGAGGVTLPAYGDSDSYSLTIGFETPVESLVFDVNSINALAKSSGFNSQDILTIRGRLNGEFVDAPSFLPLAGEDQAYIISGHTLIGDFDHPLAFYEGAPGHHVTDSGSVRVAFSSRVDAIELVMRSVAIHPDPEAFLPGYAPGDGSVLQVWAFSLGDLSFTTVPEPATGTIVALAAGALALKRRRTPARS